MKPPPVRLSSLCILIFVLAIDFVWWRDSVHRGYDTSAFGFADRGYDVGVLPMANALILALHVVVLRRGRPGAFLAGFLVFGLAVCLGYMTWAWVDPESLSRTLISRPLAGLVSLLTRQVINSSQFLVVCGLYIGLLQFGFATIGGLVVARVASRWEACQRAPLRST